MALLLANGSMSSQSSGEGDIRRALIEADLVEAMIALPGQLFTNTQIPACIWLLHKAKPRSGETLFIDARNMGYMKDRAQRDLPQRTRLQLRRDNRRNRAQRLRLDARPLRWHGRKRRRQRTLCRKNDAPHRITK